jgi:hypothetical protein
LNSFLGDGSRNSPERKERFIHIKELREASAEILFNLQLKEVFPKKRIA